MKLVAVCVSRERERWPLSDIPFLNHTSEQVAAPRGTVERVRLVASLRNAAMKTALSKWPTLTHVLMIDNYYLNQPETILQLIRAYHDPSIILGASTWILFDTRIGEPEFRFYDWGTTPEGFSALLRGGMARVSGRRRVRAVGAAYIFPVAAWLRNGYQCDNQYFVPEHVSLCEGFPTFLDFDIKFYRDPIRYSTVRKWRTLLGWYRRKWLGH